MQEIKITPETRNEQLINWIKVIKERERYSYLKHLKDAHSLLARADASCWIMSDLLLDHTSGMMKFLQRALENAKDGVRIREL